MHEWCSHTAEVELAIEASSAEDVFAEAAVAFGELVSGDEAGEHAEHIVTVHAPDRDALLVQWLEELIFLADTENFVPENAVDVRLDCATVAATLVGRRTEIEPLVKAATYHDVHFAEENGLWRAGVVLDV